MGRNSAVITLQRKQDLYENEIIFCVTPWEFLYCRKPKQLPSCLCTSQPHELSAHTENTTDRQWEASSLEWIRSTCASEQPGEMFCTQAYQSSSHCTPSTHIDGLNRAKLLQETSHILLSCPFVQLSYPERGTANYNQELSTGGQSHYWHKLLTGQITNTYPMLNPGNLPGKELKVSPRLQITAATLNTHPGFPPERHRTANFDSQHDRTWERCWQ